jgi:hypothetical protein
MIEQFKVPNVSFLKPGKIGILKAGLPVLLIVALLSFGRVPDRFPGSPPRT